MRRRQSKVVLPRFVTKKQGLIYATDGNEVLLRLSIFEARTSMPSTTNRNGAQTTQRSFKNISLLLPHAMLLISDTEYNKSSRILFLRATLLEETIGGERTMTEQIQGEHAPMKQNMCQHEETV